MVRKYVALRVKRNTETARFASRYLSFWQVFTTDLHQVRAPASGISVEHVKDLAKTTLVCLRGRHDIFTKRDKLIKTGFGYIH